MDTMKYKEEFKIEEISKPVASPVKIEVCSSGDEEDENKFQIDKKKGTCESRGTQTDQLWVQSMIEQLVTLRMKLYMEAVKEKGHLDKKISPLIKRLKQENTDLRQKAIYLKGKLETCERNMKRKSDQCNISAPPNKTWPTTTTLQQSQTILKPLSANIIQSQRLEGPIRPQQYHIVPAASYQQRMVIPNPVYYAPEMMAQNPPPNIGTQVVTTNQGMRMASAAPNDNPIQIHQRTVYVPAYNIPPTRAQIGGTNGNPHFSPIKSHEHGANVRMNSSMGQNIQHVVPVLTHLPKLKARISATANGIVLTWDYEPPGDNPEKYNVECYHLFAHQAKNHSTTSQHASKIKDWKKIGVVNALPLPMACTLTQFATGNVYHFAVLAVDIQGREGEMSNVCVIRLGVGVNQ